MERINFRLGRRQKAALRGRAKANGTSVAKEIRDAIDAYLAGITRTEFALLEAATGQTADAIAEMSAMLEASNRKADAIFAELDRLRGGGAVPRFLAQARA